VSTDSALNDSPIAELLDTWFPADDSELRTLRSHLQLVRLAPGYDLFRLGDACRNYLIVVEGCVRVQALSTGGREVVLYRVTDGQSCVITTACLISGEAYPAEGVTEIETTGLLVPQAIFDTALEHSAAFRRFVFANQGRRLSDLIQRIEDVAFGRVDVRLARHLLDRGRHHGSTITATHQQLAGELGTAREVISRQLKTFEKQGWIRVLRGSVEVLQPQALARLWKHTD
jgi:CRP/FNR family transcriptional regulator, anaerobic regulatory protein